MNRLNFIKLNNWTLRNGSLKASLFHFDNLHLIKDRNIKLSESIVNVIKPKSKTTESVSMSSKLFNYIADFSFNDKDFPPLLCSMAVYDSVCSCKPVFTSNICISKPVCTNHVRPSEPICTSHVRSSKPVCTGNVHSGKSVYTIDICTSNLVYASHVRTSMFVLVMFV